MTVVAERYQSRPFEVDAVHVTADNFDDCARWCGSTIAEEGDSRFIRVRVNKPMRPRQSKAFVGDWILYSENYGYKVYTDGAFRKLFAVVNNSGVAA